jgi:hypothetical protein
MSRRPWLIGIALLALGLGACGGGHGDEGDGGGDHDAAASDAAGGGDGGGGDGPAPSDGPGPSDGSPGPPPTIGNCQVFPPTDHWNRDVSAAPVDQGWTDKLHALVGGAVVWPDVGNYQTEHYGIPFNVVPQNQPGVTVAFDVADESDPNPYPFPGPDTIQIEGDSPYACSSDCHVLVLQQETCTLYEAYACEYRGGWNCSLGAIWDLARVAYGQRTIGWSSADAAGLPILPGLVRYDEVMAGAVRHALRFTVSCTRPNYVEPASHFAVPSSCDPNDPNAPPMGLRVRLKADYDLSGFNAVARTVAQAMKTYGMILADNGGDFQFQGERNLLWDDDIQQLKQVPASAFEVVGPVVLQP